MNFFSKIISLSALCLLLASCGAHVSLKMPEPSKFNYGKARNMVLTDMSGRRSQKELVIINMEQELRSSSWWKFVDSTEEGIRITLKGDTATVNPIMPDSNQIFVKIDIYEVDTEKNSKSVELKRDDGSTYEKVKHGYKGRAVLGFSTVESDGTVIMSEREYEGKSERYSKRRSDVDKDEIINLAIRDAVKEFIKDVTPTFRTVFVKLDDSSEDMKPLAKMISDGSYAYAIEKLEDWHSREPNRADVVYNLAVATEAAGDSETALTLYEQALTLGAKSFYHESLAKCEQRIRAQEAINK